MADKEIAVLTMEALAAAQAAFESVLSADGNDPAYWDIRFTAWLKDSTLSMRLSRYEIEEEVK